ncbi:MAG: hypothetical protein Dasosvirus14_3 [Dasosvirus sp.]|uniref:RelA/SpoT domain-containing protein n=1 Tax=Dasosvirus sp. TaxID=2487764 RepID=A0A3G4ZRX4_9VIRU|nr:MAG: hypothetical protein Dasosvirus14_3 [Dasosvirus sp.]
MVDKDLDSFLISHKNDYQRLHIAIENKLKELKDKYNVWFQSRLKSKQSIIEKYSKDQTFSYKELKDVIGFRIVYPWTKGLHDLANILTDIKELKIFSKKTIENDKVIYLFGQTSINTIYEIQFWPTIMYTCFEFEHDKVYKPKKELTEKQIEQTFMLRKNEHSLQDYIDKNILVPYDF